MYQDGVADEGWARERERDGPLDVPGATAGTSKDQPSPHSQTSWASFVVYVVLPMFPTRLAPLINYNVLPFCEGESCII